MINEQEVAELVTLNKLVQHYVFANRSHIPSHMILVFEQLDKYTKRAVRQNIYYVEPDERAT